jgi:hypothetical protein
MVHLKLSVSLLRSHDLKTLDFVFSTLSPGMLKQWSVGCYERTQPLVRWEASLFEDPVWAGPWMQILQFKAKTTATDRRPFSRTKAMLCSNNMLISCCEIYLIFKDRDIAQWCLWNVYVYCLAPSLWQFLPCSHQGLRVINAWILRDSSIYDGIRLEEEFLI